MKRREFLTLSAGVAGGALVFALEKRKLPAGAEGVKRIRVPLKFFSREEALIVSAAAARIIPSDESGPGAEEAGVVIYIDRQLAGPWGRGSRRYMRGPFIQASAGYWGFQGRENPQEIYRAGLKHLSGFTKLTAAQQDQKLLEIEETPFFEMLRRNTIEGMFSDPVHGGNAEMTGWKLIGFPGPKMSHYADVLAHFGKEYRLKPVALRDVVSERFPVTEDGK